MRILRKSAPPVLVKGHVAQLCELRWQFDVARDPDHYVGRVCSVLREQGNVLVLLGPNDEVLTRYALREAKPGCFLAPQRQAYELLQEL